MAVEVEWQVGCAENTDFGLVTVILLDDACGIQYRGRGRHIRSWLPVPPLPGALVVIAGDYLTQLRLEVKSVVHRVLSPQKQPRLSFVFVYTMTQLLLEQHEHDRYSGIAV